MRKLLLVGTIFVGASVFVSCGKESPDRKTTDHTQAEDFEQLSNSPIFSLSDTSMPDRIGPIEKSTTAVRFVALTDMFYNPYVQNREHLNGGLDVELMQSWVLQDQVDYDEKTRSLIFKDRRKYLALILDEYKGYIYQETFQSKRCDKDDLSVFSGMTHKQVVEKLRSENRYLCPNSDLQTLTQSKTLYKFSAEEGVTVKYVVETAEMLPDHQHCRNSQIDDETMRLTCGNYFHSYQIEEKEGKTAVGHMYFMKSVGRDLVFKPNQMSYYTSGTFDFLVNNWAGFVDYEKTGQHPKMTLQNIVTGAVDQHQF